MLDYKKQSVPDTKATERHDPSISRITINRRGFLLGTTASLGLAALSGCEQGQDNQQNSTLINPRADAAIKLLESLPEIDPKIGYKASETRIAGAEKVLIIIRYAHARPESLEQASTEGKKVIINSLAQSKNILNTLVSSTKVSKLSGDGLLPEDQKEINDAIKYYQSTLSQIRPLAKYKDANDVERNTSKIMQENLPGTSSYIEAQKLNNMVKGNRDLIDKTLKNFHQVREYLASLEKIEPIVHAALKNNLTLYSTEDVALVEASLTEAHGEHREDVIEQINERREDAIMDAIAATNDKISIFVAGAMHRFDNNALKREELPSSQRFHVVEYSPALFPDDIEELVKLLTR